MNNLIVFDHPYGIQASENEPHNRSFCAALCKALRHSLQVNGDTVDVIDLHADGFNPVMSAEELVQWRSGIPMNNQVADYQRRFMEADRVIFIFPLWWMLMPAMTKGFIDKVYAKNILYQQETSTSGQQDRSKSAQNNQQQQQQGKTLSSMRTFVPDCEIVMMTVMGVPSLLYKLVFGQPVVKAIQKGLCWKTGIKKFRWIPYSGVDKMTPQQRKKLLDEVHL